MMLNSFLVETIGWSLVHFVWQAIFIGLLVWVALCFSNPRDPKLRYNILCLGMLLLSICPFATYAYLMQSPGPVASRPVETTDLTIADSATDLEETENGLLPNQVQRKPARSKSIDSNVAAGLLNTSRSEHNSINASGGLDWETLKSFAKQVLTPMFPYLLFAWLIGVTFFSVRLGVACHRIHRIRTQGELLDDFALRSQMEKICRRLAIQKSIQLYVSRHISTPTTIGWIKPIVLLPATAATGLTADQLTAVLAHELAHIRRGDFLVNMIQSLIEVIFFFHPVVWWISSQIREERENCCDDLVTSRLSSKKTYAESLLKLAEAQSAPNPALNANGGKLLNRIQRLVNPCQRKESSPWLAFCIATACMAFLVLALNTTPHLNAQESDKPTQEHKLEKAPKEAFDPSKFVENMEVSVVDTDGKPIKDITLFVGVWQNQYIEDGVFPNRSYQTDANGKANLEFPPHYFIVRVWAWGDGYVPMFFNWEESEIKNGDRPPSKFQLKLQKGIVVGGSVVDDQGNPVRNAKVNIRASGVRSELKRRPRMSNQIAAVYTDEEGKWSTDRAPSGANFSIKVEHEDYLDGQFSFTNQAAIEKTAIAKLKAGVTIKGNITAPDGSPVKDGLVVWGDNPYIEPGSQETEIQSDGSFETAPLPSEKTRLTVIARGYSPWTQTVDVQTAMEDLNIELPEPNPLKLEIVDPSGSPIPKAYVQVEGWRDAQSIFNHRHPNIKDSKIPIEANPDGTWEWSWAPADIVRYNFSARGYMFKHDVPLLAGDEVQTIVLNPEKYVSGNVINAFDGEPILNARVVPLVHLRPDRDPNAGIERRDKTVTVEDDGHFDLKLHRDDCGFRLLIEADGFLAHKTDLFMFGDEIEPFKVRLEKVDPDIKTIVDVDGKPVSGAIVAVGSNASILRNFNYSSIPRDAKGFRTDTAGKVEIPRYSEPVTVVCLHDKGVSETLIDPESTDSIKEIKLRPWAKLRGAVPKKWTETETLILVHPIHVANRHIDNNLRFGPTPGGTFEIDRLPPGQAMVEFLVTNPKRPSYSRFDRFKVPMNLKPGATNEVLLTKTRTVNGKVQLADDLQGRVDLTKSRLSFRRLEPGFELPERFKKYDIKNLSQTRKKLMEQGDYQIAATLDKAFESYDSTFMPDGSFSLAVLSPGDYLMEFNLVEEIQPGGGDVVGSFIAEHQSVITVSDGDETNAPPLEVSCRPEPNVGDILPDFKFMLKDETKKISDYRGKKVLLDIWSSRSKVTIANNAKIVSLAESFMDQPDAVVISLGSKSSGTSKRKFPNPERVVLGEWIRLEGNSGLLGLWRFPKYFILDEEGRILEIGT